MNWTDGYVADNEYTSHYFGELSPAHINFIALSSGFLPPDREGGKFRYCELGCGNGLSTNILAAAHPAAEFVGIDFMPVHISNARRTARKGGLQNVEFLEISFAEACERNFEPFDYIVAHGVYSWITPENRQEMVEFFRRFLAPGGIVYLSYNCQPGWLTIAPVQKLVAEHARTLRGPSTQRAKQAFEFATQLMNKNLPTFTAYPQAKAQIEKAPSMAPNYLAQEYLNEAWYPLYVTDVMRELAPAKLEYMGSATTAENDLRLLMSEELAAVVREQPTVELAQLVKDLAINARFRRDLYSRGARRLSGLDQRQLLSEQRIALTRDPEQVQYSVEYSGRKVSFDTPVARSIVDALSQSPCRLGDLAARLSAEGAKDGLRAAMEVCTVLMSSNQALALMDVGADVTAFNAALAESALEDSAPNAFATRFGTGAGVGSLEVALMSVARQGDDLATLSTKMKALAIRKGRLFTKEGQPLREEQAIDDFLANELAKVMKQRMPILASLGIVFADA